MLTGSSKMNKMMADKYKAQTMQLKSMLGSARKVTICLDGWNKKGLTASFLRISACFCDTTSGQPRNTFLNLTENRVVHPVTMEDGIVGAEVVNSYGVQASPGEQSARVQELEKESM
jgi:hypothetical protein